MTSSIADVTRRFDRRPQECHRAEHLALPFRVDPHDAGLLFREVRDCKGCGGCGWMIWGDLCPYCEGRGWERVDA